QAARVGGEEAEGRGAREGLGVSLACPCPPPAVLARAVEVLGGKGRQSGPEESPARECSEEGFI
ncbi:hypothetical protein P7K49_021233, partial [Saguinus oedipus]